MARNLVLHVTLHDRFHGMAFGAPEWPPSPARVFQALVAGVARGRRIAAADARALEWLEALAPPRIGAPRSRAGTPGALWVPNNDLDAKEGDPANIGELRTAKRVLPRILEGDEPLLYVWSWEPADPHGGEYAEVLVAAAEHLYQLGRGVDLAWARAELLDDLAVERLLARYPGVLHLPRGLGGPSGSLCPMPGSLDSLCRRFEVRRIREVIEKKKRTEIFENAPKPVFRPVRYGRHAETVVYDLLDATDDRRSFPVALDRVAELVVAVRDDAARRLRHEFPGQGAEIERVLIGRKPDGRGGGPIEDRIRIMPLPSIGHPQADLAVRRLAVEFPGGAALPVEDLAWAFDGLSPVHPETGEVAYILARSDGSSMLDRYRSGARRFRTVTAIVLPQDAARRRIEPSRRAEEAKPGRERHEEEQRAQVALRAALRHAGVVASPEEVAVQREPFDRRGARAESFADGTRFAKERLWHAVVTFDRRLEGPIVVGDGRFLGLGVMAPMPESIGVYAFAIGDGLAEHADPGEVARALRRAVMARVHEVLGPRAVLPSYFSGHADGGKPAHDADDPHLSFALDGRARRLLVIAPHVLDRREPHAWERAHLATLDAALEMFHQLRAGRAGVLALRRVAFDRDSDPLSGVARSWRSLTPYRVNRHAKRVGASEVLVADVRLECLRRGLPEPRVTARAARGVPGQGLFGEVELEFARPVSGPVLLGRDRHLGGGLFMPVLDDAGPAATS